MTTPPELQPLADELVARGFTPEQAAVLLDGAERRQVAAGDYLYAVGQTERVIHFLLAGYVRTYGQDNNGKQWTRYLFEPGRFVASIDSFLYQQPAAEFAQCISPCTVISVAPGSLARIRNTPGMMVRLQDMTIRVLLELARERSIMLTMNATERYTYFIEKYPNLIRNVPLSDIASYIGIRQQSLSRIRRIMRSNGQSVG